jgi:hypothetical protein
LVPKYSEFDQPLHLLDKWLLRLTVPFTGTNETFLKYRNKLKASLPKVVWDEECMYDLAEKVDGGDIPSCSIVWLETKMHRLGIRYLDKRRVPSLRLTMAWFGGLTLIIPMLIMVFKPSRNTSLITTSVATFLFAIVIALGARDCTGKDILTGTAAYAAVLVVFVGTTMTTSTAG